MIESARDFLERLLHNGYELAELSGRVEADDPNVPFARYVPVNPGLNNIAARYPNRLAWRVNKTWNEDTEQSKAIEELLALLNPPTITIPHVSKTYLLSSSEPVRAANVPRLGGAIVASEVGFLVSGFLWTTNYGMTSVHWADRSNVCAPDAPDELMEQLGKGGLLYRAI